MNDMYLADELGRQTLSNQTLLKSNIFKQELNTKRLSNDLIFNFIDGTKAPNNDTTLQVNSNIMNESIDEEHEYDENDFETGDEPNCFKRYTADSIRHRKKIEKKMPTQIFKFVV